jgi:hypothetical protein
MMPRSVVQFDPDYMRASMTLWQESIDLRILLKDDLKVHMMRNRRPILGKYVQLAGGWLAALKAMPTSAYQLRSPAARSNWRGRGFQYVVYGRAFGAR